MHPSLLVNSHMHNCSPGCSLNSRIFSTSASLSTDNTSPSASVLAPHAAQSPAPSPSPASSRMFMSGTSLDRVLLLRHAESLGNTGEQSAQLMGDHNLELSALGQQQAHRLGRQLGRGYFLPADRSTAQPLLYISPYKRTRQTMSAMLEGAGVRPDEVEVVEDVRLREVEFGYAPQQPPLLTPHNTPHPATTPTHTASSHTPATAHSAHFMFSVRVRLYSAFLRYDTDRPGDVPIPQQEELRRTHGWFFYRFRGGESPADCYDRMSSFLASLHRQLLRCPSQSVLVLSHGLTLRCLLMRWLRLSVEQFDALDNPAHCEPIELLRGSGRGDRVGQWLTAGSTGGSGGGAGSRERLWSVRGLRVRNENEDWKKHEMREASAANSNHDSESTEGRR